VQTDSNNGLTDENAVLSIVPMPLAATITATLMPAATNVHLIAVMARWSELE
jgi:phosphoribosylcarboxyaminoimidazole (NCAIR) mutase